LRWIRPNNRAIDHKNRPTLHKNRPYPQGACLINNGFLFLYVGLSVYVYLKQYKPTRVKAGFETSFAMRYAGN